MDQPHVSAPYMSLPISCYGESSGRPLKHTNRQPIKYIPGQPHVQCSLDDRSTSTSLVALRCFEFRLFAVKRDSKQMCQ